MVIFHCIWNPNNSCKQIFISSLNFSRMMIYFFIAVSACFSEACICDKTVLLSFIKFIFGSHSILSSHFSFHAFLSNVFSVFPAEFILAFGFAYFLYCSLDLLLCISTLNFYNCLLSLPSCGSYLMTPILIQV